MATRTTTPRTETATFAAGCFWGVEEAFRTLPGVVATSVGYTGGTVPDATYEQVCAGRTGHAEAVEVVFDPQRISYDQLLKVFWETHDPTTRNRQGPDVGSQYRSAIFTHSPLQEQQAIRSRTALGSSGKFHSPIVTEIVRAGPFYRAEDYHQQYVARGGAAACRA